MARTRLVAAVAVVAVLALPAASVADSAGDNQYQDPFSNAPSQQTKPKKQTSSGTQTQGSSTPAPASPTPTATTATPPPSGTSGELPRTGFPVLPVAGVGVLLVGAGLLLLRRRTA